MDRTPEISVLVAAHNAAGTIEHAVRSALDAGGPAVEVLIVDDASTDETAARTRDIGDERVRLTVGPVNAGPAASRNLALAQARGAWLAVLDADDWYAPRRLAALLAAAVECDADLVADNLLYAAAPDAAPWRTLFSPREIPRPTWLDPLRFVACNTPGTSGPRLGLLKPLMRREFLERHDLRYDARLRYTEDFLLYAQCLMRGARFRVLPEALYGYRCRPGLRADRRSESDLRDALRANRELAEAARAAGDAALVAALEHRDSALERDVAYRFALEAIDRREWGSLLRAAVRDPGAVVYVAGRARQALTRRLRRRPPAPGHDLGAPARVRKK